jgi:hypothetical protein
VCPFQGATGHIRQKQAGRFRLLALRKEAILDPCLGPRQPIQILLERIFIKRAYAKHVTGSMGYRETHGREAGALIKDAGVTCHSASFPSRVVPSACAIPKRRATW